MLTQISSNNSYPSGHTTKSYAIAYISGFLIQQKRAEFLENAQEISNRRVLVGEHFPVDIIAGRRLSLLIVGGLIQNSEFQKDFQEAKKELQRHEDAVAQEKLKLED